MLRKAALAAILLAALLFPVPSLGEPGRDPVLLNVSLADDGKVVLFSTHLDPVLEESALTALRGGVPLVFRFTARLTRRGGGLLGEKMELEKELVHSLHFDPLRGLFLFTGEGYGTLVERTTREEEEALAWMRTVSAWPLIPLEDLMPRTRYRLRVMATLRSVELPSVLGYLFFFTSIFNQQTPWVQLDFTY